MCTAFAAVASARQPPLDAVAVIDAMETIGVSSSVFDSFIDAFATASDVSLDDLYSAGLAGTDIVQLRRQLQAGNDQRPQATRHFHSMS